MGLAPIDSLEALLARGDTLAGLERLLHLSPGYLSKVRGGRATPSAQLAALLELLVQHPEVRGTLSASGAEAARAPVARSKVPARPVAFLQKLTLGWKRHAVRFQPVDDLLLDALGVPHPEGLERSFRYLVHPDDRHAVHHARKLGATIGTAGARASVCAPPGGHESVVIVFPIEPLLGFVAARTVTPTDAALYFALQAGEDAEARFSAVATTHALRKVSLRKAFSAAYGGAKPLPQKEWLLRAMFDPDLARRRLSGLR